MYVLNILIIFPTKLEKLEIYSIGINSLLSPIIIMGDNKDYHNDYDNYDYYLITMLTCSFTDFILVGSQLESTIGNTIDSL